jgi:hypothetical protein
MHVKSPKTRISPPPEGAPNTSGIASISKVIWMRTFATTSRIPGNDNVKILTG